MNETNAFNAFDEELKLDPAERLRAEKCHNEISLLLKSKGLIVSAFLQGSIARKTMVSPLRDIDKVVILAESLRRLTPDEVMDRLEDALRVHYPKATFDRTRHSLKLDFGGNSFCFDVVPAWETNTDDDDVLIANRETGGWERSNTRELLRNVAQRNRDCDGDFVHIARMVKHLVAHSMDEVIPGLHVESIAYVAVQKPTSFAEGCVAVIETAAHLLGSSYSDPTGKDRISERLTDDQRTLARQAFSDAAIRVREARALVVAGDDANAIRIWHDLLGEPFPLPKRQSLGAALTGAAAGSVTSTGHISRTTAARQAAPPTRSWRPT